MPHPTLSPFPGAFPRAFSGALLLASAALLAACAGRPATQVEAASPLYQADVAACRESVPAAVDKQNAKTGLAWIVSPVRRWSQVDEGVDRCMTAKGWGHVRACTSIELRQGNRDPHLVVTADGVRCVDPGRAR